MKQRAGRSVCEIPLMLRLPRAYFHQNLERISRPPFERKRTRTRAELELAGDPEPGFDGNWKRPFFPRVFFVGDSLGRGRIRGISTCLRKGIGID